MRFAGGRMHGFVVMEFLEKFENIEVEHDGICMYYRRVLWIDPDDLAHRGVFVFVWAPLDDASAECAIRQVMRPC